MKCYNYYQLINRQMSVVKTGGSRIVFMGTPEFAVPILGKLVNNGYEPVAVFCAPDKPVGRKQVLTPPPVKVIAQKYNIPVYQPASTNELLEQLATLNCDLVISAAFSMILPKATLDLPRFSCLNIHPSLLPKYRGASPIQSAILNGDPATGVTIYKMDEQVDHGAIIAQKKIQIKETRHSDPATAGEESRGIRQSAETRATDIIRPTTPDLSKKLSNLGAELLLETLPHWLTGKIMPTPQDDSLASHTKIIKKEDGQIDWQKSAQEIEQQIRAYVPWPSAYANLKIEKENIKIKILKAEPSKEIAQKQIGEIFLNEKNELAVQCGQGCLVIKSLQLEGGKPLDAPDFLRGHVNLIGKVLE